MTSYLILFFLVLAVVWVVAHVEVSSRERPNPSQVSTPQAPGAPVKSATPAEPAPRYVLCLDGMQRIAPAHGMGFVKAFSVNPAEVTDLARLDGPATFVNFPPGLKTALQQMYKDGCLHGLEAMQLVTHPDGAIAQNEALYVTVAQAGPSRQPAVVGFIDKAAR